MKCIGKCIRILESSILVFCFGARVSFRSMLEYRDLVVGQVLKFAYVLVGYTQLQVQMIFCDNCWSVHVYMSYTQRQHLKLACAFVGCACDLQMSAWIFQICENQFTHKWNGSWNTQTTQNATNINIYIYINVYFSLSNGCASGSSVRSSMSWTKRCHGLVDEM